MEMALSKFADPSQLMAWLVLILTLHLLLKIGQIAFETVKKKSELSERAIEGLGKIEHRMASLERDLNEILKFRQDFKRLFTAVKVIAGDRWPDVRKAILEDDLHG